MAIEPLILLNGTTADANQVMALFNEIYSNIADNNIAANANISLSKLQTASPGKIVVYNVSSVLAPVTMSGAATINSSGVVTLSATGSGGTVPIGTVVPWLDYNGMVSFDAGSWKMMDGTMIGSGPLAGQSTEDLSGRYLIGFGTDGGGDIETAPWATGQVGNVSSQINIQHTHTENTHTHSSGSLAFTLSAHTHAPGSFSYTLLNHTHAVGSFAVPGHYHGLGTISISGGAHTHNITVWTPAGSVANQVGQGGNGTFSTANAQALSNTHAHPTGEFSGLVGASGSGISGDSSFAITGTSAGPSSNSGSVTGTSAGPSTDSTGTGSGVTSTQSDTGMSSSLSTTQDIRPSSIRCRYILRIN